MSTEPSRTRVAPRLRLTLLGVYTLFVVAWASLSALTKPFQFDELCTWYVANQPSVAAMWDALAAGSASVSA